MKKHMRYFLMGLILLLVTAPVMWRRVSASSNETAHVAVSANRGTISGSFTVINPSRAVTAELRLNTSAGALISTTVIPVTAASISAPATFEISYVVPGTYSLIFRQPGHTSFIINGIVVTAGGNVDLSRDNNFPNQLPLHPGDINGDGQVNIVDLSLLLQNWLGDNINMNFTNSGQINITDLGLLLQNWMAESVVVQAGQPIVPTPSPTPIPTPTPTPATPPPLMVIPNRQLTAAERDTWVTNYHTRGGANTFELEVLRLINTERENAGITPLDINLTLMLSARFKAQSMLDLNYFGMTHPHYGTFAGIPENLFDMRTRILSRGGQIMRWYQTPQIVVDRWMANPGQRQNLLNPNFDETGIGAVNTGTGSPSFNNFWVIIFVETEDGVINPPDIPQSQIQIPNRRMSQQELNNWIAEYNAMGGVNIFEHEVLRLTNIERANAGLSPLRLDTDLMMAARFKSQSMGQLNYFAHTHPVFGAFYNMPREMFGIDIRSENLAIWHRTPAGVVNGWMSSPDHRAAILNPAFTELGVGFYRDRWTQLFR